MFSQRRALQHLVAGFVNALSRPSSLQGTPQEGTKIVHQKDVERHFVVCVPLVEIVLAYL